jgi:hypothetical protein
MAPCCGEEDGGSTARAQIMIILVILCVCVLIVIMLLCDNAGRRLTLFIKDMRGGSF